MMKKSKSPITSPYMATRDRSATHDYMSSKAVPPFINVLDQDSSFHPIFSLT